MPRFIPKEALTEGMAANPLDKGVAEEQDITTLAQEGILTAAAAETDAINQYMQILDMVDRSESWLSNLVKPTLEDIISEEKKHFAQLSTIVSKLPAFEKEFKAGKEEAETGKDKEREEVKESVAKKSSEEYNKYDLDTIIKIITEETTITTDYLYDNADAYNYVELDGLYPQQVDDFLALFTFNPETLEKIEQRIIAEADIEANNVAKQKADEEEIIADAIYSLKTLVQDSDDIHYIKHPEIRQKIWDIISEYTDVDSIK